MSEKEFISTTDMNEAASIHSDPNYINWKNEYIDGEYRFYNPTYEKKETDETKNNEQDIYMTLEELAPILSESGYVYHGHGTGNDSEKIVDSIFSKGLRTKMGSLYYTTITLDTPTPENIETCQEKGLDVPTIENLKKQLDSWPHQDSKKIIIARTPIEYINANGDISDLRGERYGAFYINRRQDDGRLINYLDSKFIIGCYDVEKQAVRMNKKFEKELSEATIEQLENRYKKVQEQIKERLEREEQLLSMLMDSPYEQTPTKKINTNIQQEDSMESLDEDSIVWDLPDETISKGKSI